MDTGSFHLPLTRATCSSPGDCLEDCNINGNSSMPDGDTCRAEEEGDDDILFLFCIILDGKSYA